MICTNCGNALEEGALFCPKCGQSVAQETVEAVTEVKTKQAAEPVQEIVASPAELTPEETAGAAEQAQEPAVSESELTPEEAAGAAEQAASAPAFTEEFRSSFASGQVDAQEPVMEKAAGQFKMPSKKVWIIGAVAAVLVVVLAVVLVNFQTLANSVKKLTMSPQEYFVYIEKKQLQEMTADLAANYDRSMAVYTDASGQSLEYGLDVELGQLLCEVLSSSLGIEDASGLSKIGLDFYFANKEGVFSGGMAAGLGDTNLLSLNAVAMLEKGMIYMQLPELSEKFISVDISEDMGEIEDAFEQYSAMMEAYPEGAVLEDMVNRYMTIVIDSFEDVKEVKDVVAVGEYEEKCTTLCATMTEPEIYTMLEAMLKEAKGDKELQDMMVAFASYADVADEQELRDSFNEAIDTALEELADYKAQADAERYLSMSIMVNNKGEVIGRKLDVNKQEFLLSYMMPQKEDAFGYELKAGNVTSLVVIEGEGTKTSSEMSGEFLIRMDSVDIGQFDIATLVIESMDLEKWDDGLLDMTCRIKPDMDLYSELGMGAAGVFLAGYELIYESDVEKNQAEVTLSLVNGSELVCKLVVSTKLGQYEGMEVPADSIAMETDEDLLTWMQTMDFDKFMDNIEQSGMPAGLVEIIEYYIDDLSTMISYGAL